MRNYCGNYGCKNCKWFNHYPSYNYYEPDEYECSIDDGYFKEINSKISYTNDEIDERITRAYSDGEEWNTYEEQICPYYNEQMQVYDF